MSIGNQFLPNGPLIRAARALIGWKQPDLMNAADIGETLLRKIEGTDELIGQVQHYVRVRAALEAANVQFILPNADKGILGGVALRDPDLHGDS